MSELYQFVFDVSVAETFPTDTFINLLYDSNFIDNEERHKLKTSEDEGAHKWQALNFAEKRLTKLEDFATLYKSFETYGIGTERQREDFYANLKVILFDFE